MSSILEALKKAEQDSTTDRGADTPWPAPSAAKSSHRKRTRRWWVPLGVVVVLGVSGAVFWSTRRAPPRPAVSVKAAVPSQKTDDHAPPPVAQDLKSNVTLAEPTRAKAAETMFQGIVPVDAKPPVQPVTKKPQAVTPAPSPMVKSSPLPMENPPGKRAVLKPEPVIAPPEAPPVRRRAEIAASTGQPVETSPDSGKIFRNDPRIDLQALVWAPEAAERFVVINNRLMKEGGSVDNIVLVRINPDDVLLAEGSDRWHEEFKVR